MTGKKMLALFLKEGFEVVGQKGSHIQVKKGTQNQTIPYHKELAKGTERMLLKYLAQSKKNK